MGSPYTRELDAVSVILWNLSTLGVVGAGLMMICRTTLVIRPEFSYDPLPLCHSAIITSCQCQSQQKT
jgi:hypothetical protein